MKHLVVILLLGISLFACPLAHSADYFNEEFNSLDTTRWSVSPRNGQIFTSGGILSMNAGQSNLAPFLALNSNPFPTLGAFTLTMGIQYTKIGTAGTGVAADIGIPPFTSIVTQASIDSPFQWWADNVGFSYNGVPPYRYLPGQANTAYQTVEFTYGLDDSVTFLLNGVIQDTYAGHRPSALWLGNPTEFSLGEIGDWSSFQVDYIRVVSLQTVAVPEQASLPLLATGGIFGLLCPYFLQRVRFFSRRS